MKDKATIYDLWRLCNKNNAKGCQTCPLKECVSDFDWATSFQSKIDEPNEIILNWCKEHPVKTRQDKFLEMFPNAKISDDKVLAVCPKEIDKTFDANCHNSCSDCKKSYWLAEVEE